MRFTKTRKPRKPRKSRKIFSCPSLPSFPRFPSFRLVLLKNRVLKRKLGNLGNLGNLGQKNTLFQVFRDFRGFRLFVRHYKFYYMVYENSESSEKSEKSEIFSEFSEFSDSPTEITTTFCPSTLDNRNVCSVDIITSNVTREECREECALKTTTMLPHRQLHLLRDGGRVMYLTWYIKFCCRRSGTEPPNFFLVYRVKVKRRMFYSFYRKFGRFEVSEFHFERFDFIPPSRPIFFNFHWKNMEIDLKISFDVVEVLSSLRSPINVYSTSKS